MCCEGVWQQLSPEQESAPRAAVVVPHVRQLYNWDCGLACVLMVLRALGIHHQNLQSLSSLCPTTSIWTVDLAHLLRHFGLDVLFTTMTIGANPEYARESFYMENMAEDEQRIQRLFQGASEAGIRGASEAGIRVQRRSVSAHELQSFLMASSHLVVALVDKRRLGSGFLWGHAPDMACLPQYCGMQAGYTGHYIVICSYDPGTDRFEIRDPASPIESVTVSATCLDAARRSFGTDEDLLLISTDGSLQPQYHQAVSGVSEPPVGAS
ncbi:hypothetical protein WJX72_007781 [[Myrmecia] bisecta]|uniref:Guanylyl cyclase n=1 Tax=[Myrmecia] bisecta TaxID=41462 RepID=A0AAW1P952_9CHLO